MRILIHLPSSLDEAILLNPTILNILDSYDDLQLILIGDENSIDLYRSNLDIRTLLVFKSTFLTQLKQIKTLGKFDIFINFNNHFKINMVYKSLKAKQKIVYKDSSLKTHKVLVYQDFISKYLNIKTKEMTYNLYTVKSKTTKTVGFNLGLEENSKSYNNNELLLLAQKISSYYDIVLFGSPMLVDAFIKALKVKNITNVVDCSKFKISEQIKQISSLSKLITIDDYISQISSIYQIPTIVIFGSSDISVTSPWMHHNVIMLTKNLYCSPCNKDKCPIKSHDCMVQIKAKDVYNAYTKLDNNIEMTIQRV